ncbi:MAG: N(4)-(beta-N-acetylglucosaminyl)-L-asparaginase [Ardenticatenaceae bacterium]|nr:N(4)-(beta-N-acetylglucosaminyl)-L-asparaginase [Ardenticatenaceae bacterium]
MNTTPLLVGSTNARAGFAAAMDRLRHGDSALDAAEVAVRAVEDNLEDHSVGIGGLPNLVGEVELDAMIMDGETLVAGAVAALKGYPNPVSVSRKVMEVLPHVLLVGEGAARFAAEMGFEPRELLTEEARKIWADRLSQVPAETGERAYFEKMAAYARHFATDPEGAAARYDTNVTGTVNVLACDQQGRLAVATSTSGWAWKYPGRVGDTPIVGAGGYADSRYGACGCVGRGEMALRAGTARSLVLYLKMGLPLWNAAREAIHDLSALQDPFASGLSLVAIDAAGNHVGFSNRTGRDYIFQTAQMDVPEKRPRIFVDASGKAQVRPA